MARETDDGGGAQALDGKDLRTEMKRLSKGPLNFAFGFKDRQHPILVVHKNKSPAQLRNQLKTKLGAKTATHGVASADGKALVLDVEGPPIPGMKKMVKELLRMEQVAKYTEARVRVGGAEVAEEEVAADPAALLERLRALQRDIQAREAEVGQALRSLAAGDGGDLGLLIEYGKLCADFAKQAQGCDDDDLVSFGQDRVGRAKKVAGVAKRSAKHSSKSKAKEEPDEGGGVGIEVSDDDGGSVGLKHTPDGTTLTIKEEKSLPVLNKPFAIGPVPCYLKGSLKAAFEGSITVGNTAGGGLTASAGGSLELGVGFSNKTVTAGPYGAVSLTASGSSSVSYTDKDGLDAQAFTFQVKGSGKLGVKVEIEDYGAVDVDCELFDWELFVVNVGRYSHDKFEFIDVRAGKDLLRLIAALEAGGPKIEAAVEKYAPQFVKDAAVAAAEEVAEGEPAKQVADGVQEGLDLVEQKTGVDVGEGVEELVQSLVDENGETSAEATARVNEGLERAAASQDDLHALMDATGLNGELRKYRDSTEYNKIIEVWRTETDQVALGKPCAYKWKSMTVELAKAARARKAQEDAQRKAWEQQQKADQDERTKAALAYMEGVRTEASGAGVLLDNKLKQTPNAEAKQYARRGYTHWAAAEEQRRGVQGAQGPAKVEQAGRARSLYEQAKAEWRTGLQLMR